MYVRVRVDDLSVQVLAQLDELVVEPEASVRVYSVPHGLGEARLLGTVEGSEDILAARRRLWLAKDQETI